MSVNSKRTEGNGIESLDWMLSVDDRLLAHFGEHGPGLCPEAAGLLGLHVSFAERRCKLLCEHGFLYEHDTRYRLTELGLRYVEGL